MYEIGRRDRFNQTHNRKTITYGRLNTIRPKYYQNSKKGAKMRFGRQFIRSLPKTVLIQLVMQLEQEIWNRKHNNPTWEDDIAMCKILALKW